MNRQTLVDKLENLEGKVVQLLSQHDALRKQLAKTEKENLELRAIIEKQIDEIKNFQNQDKISKIVSSIADDTHNSNELKLKINEYIKEIDKCIAYLSE